MTSDALPMRARAPIFAGLFLVTLSTLTYQLLLTRIFSVTMSYHFAFVAVSVTMFGLAVGGIAVFLRPPLVVRARAPRDLGTAARREDSGPSPIGRVRPGRPGGERGKDAGRRGYPKVFGRPRTPHPRRHPGRIRTCGGLSG